MQESRRSVFGARCVPKPVRLDTLGYTGPSKSPLGSRFPTPRNGSCKRVLPVRESDVKELRVLLSSVKKQTDSNKQRLKTPKSRRCLYSEDDSKNMTSISKNMSCLQSKSGSSMQESSKHTKASRIPRVSYSGSNSTKSTAADRKVSKVMPPRKPNTSRKTPKKNTSVIVSRPPPEDSSTSDINLQQELLNEIRSLSENKKISEGVQAIVKAQELLEKAQAVIETQKDMLEEAKVIIEQQKHMFEGVLKDFTCFLQEHRSTLQSMPSVLIKQNQTEVENSNTSSPELLVKENSKSDIVQPKSVAEYRAMRKSFNCLHTPRSSATKKARTPKARTPRSLLSAKVKSQLENLLDE